MANLNNPKQLKDHILRRLGAPVVNVEVTEEQIYDCIQRTLDIFGEYHFEGTNKTYVAVEVDEKMAREGMITLTNVGSAMAVTKIIRTSLSCAMMFGGTPYAFISDFILSLTGAQGVLRGGILGNGASMISSVMSYTSLLADLLHPLPEYDFNAMTHQLRLFSPLEVGDILMFEVMVMSYVDLDRSISVAGSGFKAGMGSCSSGSTMVTQEQIYNDPMMAMTANFAAGDCGGFLNQSVYGHHWVCDYSTALVKYLQGQILGKHQGMMLPGGITIDGVRLSEEAQVEIDKLHAELYTLQMPDAILYG